MKELLYGRALLESELHPDMDLDDVQVLDAMEKNQNSWLCKRCGSKDATDVHPIPCSCGLNCYYCRSCLNMGQVKSCSKLYALEERNQFPEPKDPVLTWTGQLSDQQAQASQEIVASIDKKETRLIWAVAGAGKTEMLFEGIAYALKKKERVCIASPRVDVCLELAPRLKAAFSGIDQVTLHGGMEEDYRYTQLLIATTHQLLRFKRAFDLLVVDEVDAFPFYNDRMLHFAVDQARKESSTLLYLSATPDAKLQQQVKNKALVASILPARYHGYPLPVPEFVWAGRWSADIFKRPKKSCVIQKMKEKYTAGRRFLLFVPEISWMHAFEKLCQQLFPKASFTSVYSQDPDRAEKVRAMREEKYDFLMTSTILERGVTFKDIDVLVLGAEHRIFTESALVQIAGRVGRHPDYPSGQVLFFHYGQSQAMKAAKRQIQRMNQLAKERGLLL